MRIKNKPTIFLTAEEISILRRTNETMCNICDEVSCSECPMQIEKSVCGLDVVQNLLDVSKLEENEQEE